MIYANILKSFVRWNGKTFCDFLSNKIRSEENVLFWESVQEYKQIHYQYINDTEQLPRKFEEKALEIHKKFLRSDSEKEVNTSKNEIQKVEKILFLPRPEIYQHIDIHLFDSLEQDIEMVMVDTYKRFRVSQMYELMLQDLKKKQGKRKKTILKVDKTTKVLEEELVKRPESPDKKSGKTLQVNQSVIRRRSLPPQTGSFWVKEQITKLPEKSQSAGTPPPTKTTSIWNDDKFSTTNLKLPRVKSDEFKIPTLQVQESKPSITKQVKTEKKDVEPKVVKKVESSVMNTIKQLQLKQQNLNEKSKTSDKVLPIKPSYLKPVESKVTKSYSFVAVGNKEAPKLPSKKLGKVEERVSKMEQNNPVSKTLPTTPVSRPSVVGKRIGVLHQRTSSLPAQNPKLGNVKSKTAFFAQKITPKEDIQKPITQQRFNSKLQSPRSPSLSPATIPPKIKSTNVHRSNSIISKSKVESISKRFNFPQPH